LFHELAGEGQGDVGLGSDEAPRWFCTISASSSLAMFLPRFPWPAGWTPEGAIETQGAERWIEVVPHRTPELALSALHEQGFTTVATHPEGNLAPDDLAKLPRVALILGNEHDGIRDALHQGAKESVRIPMRGFVESFNVSVAAAVLLYAATRGREGDLPEAEQLRFYARALVRSVPRSLDVLAAVKAKTR
jgi:SpoU rRNA Methylase family